MNLSKMRNLLFLTIIYFLFVPNLFARSTPDGFADLVEELIPSVVSIASKTMIKEQYQQPLPRFPEGSPLDEFFKDFYDREQRKSPSLRPMYGLGSGFIIDPAGIVVTNNHVIEGADEITIIMFDQEEYKAELLGRDPKGDLAVLKFDPGEREISSVNWGNSDEVRVGDWSIAIGNPLGLGGTVTAGVVSAISRDIGNGPYVKFIQTDASINRGNSGGPLFSTNGEVIGINTAIISQSGGSIGLGFAIPSNSAKKITKQLKEFGRTIRGWLGVQVTAVSKEIAESLGLSNEKGAFISNLNPDGPSKAAGLQEGDVILKFNNIEIIKMTDLPRIVAESDVGSIASVEIWRKNKIITLEVRLGELPEESFVKRSETNKNEKTYFINSLNLTVGHNFEKDGVNVIETDDDSKLIPGDIIIEINREPITTIDSFLKLVETINKTGRNSLLLKIIRDEKSLWVTIKFHR
jgi:serine protease Do